MNKKNNILKAIIAIAIILALILPNSIIANVEIISNNDISNKPMISIKEIESSESDIDWWPMHRHDLNNTGFSTSIGPNTNNIRWIHSFGYGQIYSSPAVVDERVYVGSYNKKIYCLNASDGSEIWNYATNDEIWSSPAVAYGMVYICSDDNNIYCLDAMTGSFIWSHVLDDYNYGHRYSSPTVAYGRVYVGSMRDCFYCLNATDGSLIWSYDTGRVLSSPAIVDGKIFISSKTYGGHDGNIYCLNATDGSFIWRYTIDGYGIYQSSPAVAYGKIYFGCDDDNVYCLDATDGSFIWKYAIGRHGIYHPSPAVAYGRVFISGDVNHMYCLNASDGSEIWVYWGYGYTPYSSPAVANGMVYFGGVVSPGDFFCIDAQDGSEIWLDSVPEYSPVSHPTIADGKVYVGRGHTICCYERSNHNVGIISIDSPANGPATIFTPEVTMQNLGPVNEIEVPVNMIIEKIEFPNTIIEYNETITVDIDSEETKSIVFPEDWTPEDIYDTSSGSIQYRITACTQLINDGEPDNDYLIETITLDYIHDVGIKMITEPSAPLRDDSWIHFDDGTTYTGIGLGSGGTFEAAIRITPMELEEYANWELTAVKFYHYDSCRHSGIIKIYDDGTFNRPGPLITSEPYVVMGEGWFEIPLSNPIFLDADKDIWVSIEITHLMGEHPIGIDDGPAIDGKGDWFYYEEYGWIELQDLWLNYNWNIWAKVEEIKPWPSGTYPVECVVKNYGSFNESDFNINATIYTDDNEIFYHDDFLVITTMYLQDEITVAFDDVTFKYSDRGLYRLEVTTELINDSNLENNLKTKIVIIGLPDIIPPDITLEKEKMGFRKFKFTANVNDPEPSSGINRIEFYLDGEPQATFPEDDYITNESYEWIWQGFGNHTITAVAYDNAGNNASASVCVPSIVEQVLEWIRSILNLR